MKKSWKPIVVLPVFAGLSGIFAVDQNSQEKDKRHRANFVMRRIKRADPSKEIHDLLQKHQANPNVTLSQNQIQFVQENKPAEIGVERFNESGCCSIY